MNPAIQYKLRQVTRHGFLIEMKEQYDLSMFFCRCEEYYESPYEDIKGKPFTFPQLMHRYSHDTKDAKHLYTKLGTKVGKLFLYPYFWIGFNIPGPSIEACLATVPDWNQYDELMLRIITQIKQVTNKFYIIGVLQGDNDVFEHELAHVLYSTEPKYKMAMDKLIDNLPVKRLIFNILRKEKYGEDHMYDECQAYLSTPSGRGHMPRAIDGVLPGDISAKFGKPFKDVYRRWTKNSPVLIKARGL